MTEGEIQIDIQSIPFGEVAAALSRTRPFSGIPAGQLYGVDQVERVVARAGATLVEPGQSTLYYWVVLDGEIRAERNEPDGSTVFSVLAQAGEGFGETPLLLGRAKSHFFIRVVRDSVLVRFPEDGFWNLMACCPELRQVVLGNMAQRLQAYQVEALHREKLISLGTMAAGLMHELNNPGSAAKRAASQLRENLMRLQELSLRSSAHPKTPPQLECMHDLLEHAVRSCHAPALSTIDQADAEEAMSDWLQSAGVENAYRIGPALVEIGFSQQELDCARAAFFDGGFSDALNWLEALVSSVSLVCAIEESISRVTELVMAVKKFAYDERSMTKSLDVHDGLQSTLTLLGHKLRIKQVAVEKRFTASPSIIKTRGFALSQVWTNLIDNAVDASPANSQIEIATWTEQGTAQGTEPATEPVAESENASIPAPGWLAVSITDHGTGIPPEVLPRIFEPFFTTKPQGMGTGLGLEIVQRIVTQKFGGTIKVESEPGNTRFTVRLPLDRPDPPKPV
jgi:signal transduction histidine kinase